MGTWESFRTPESLEFDCKGQNTSHWGILYIIRKLLKCRCPKWVHMTHLDIYNTSYGPKKIGSQSDNLIPDHGKSGIDRTPLRCMQVVCNMPLESSWRGLQLWLKPRHDRRSAPEVTVPQSCKTPSLGDKKTIWMPLPQSDA
jgi:hypothetical protein